MSMNRKQWLMLSLPAMILLLVAASGNRTNPPIERTVDWDSPQTEALFDRACADCHSHATKWPWYAHVAPISWRVIEHVEEGREHFNISAADLGEADEAAEELEEGEMPLKDYLRFHPEARLTAEEKNALLAGLRATFGEKKHKGGGHEEHEKHEG